MASLIAVGSAIGLALTGAIAAPLAVGGLLAWAGFTAAGVAAGSMAAAWQATIGNVVAGSIFAVFQSLAASGIPAFVSIIGGVGGLIGGLLCL